MGLSLEELSIAMAESASGENGASMKYKGVETDITGLDAESIYQLLAEQIGQGIIREGGNY